MPSEQVLNTTQLIGLFLAAVVAAWVIADAMKRGKELGLALLWGTGVFLALIVFLPLYFYMRSREKSIAVAAPATTACKYCGKYFAGDPNYCPHCEAQLKGAAEIHANMDD